MNIRSFIGGAFTAIAIATAIPAAAHEPAETVTPSFEQTIPNIPGKSVGPWLWIIHRQEHHSRTSTQNQLSFLPMSCLEKSSRR